MAWPTKRGIGIAHGCSSFKAEAMGNKRRTNLSRRYLKGFLARRRVEEGRLEEGADGDSGADEKFCRVQQNICTFLVGVVFTARNPEPRRLMRTSARSSSDLPRKQWLET